MGFSFSKLRKGWITFGVLAIVGAVSAQAAQTRLKTFVEIPAYFEATTGTPTRSAEVQSFFFGREAILPQSGALSELTSQGIIVATSLAAIYCERMVRLDATQADAQKRWANKMINFSALPASVYQGVTLNALLQEYAAMFWFRGPAQDEAAELSAFVSEQVSKLPPRAESHQKILTALCTTMATSFDSLSY